MTSNVLILAFVVTCVSCQNNSVDVKVSTDGRDARLDAGWTHDFGNGFRARAGGNVDTRGNIGGSLEASGNGFNVRASTDGHNERVEAGWERNFRNGLSVGAGGQWDSRGDPGVFARARWRFRRSTELMKYFTLSLDVNRCNFNMYDVNRDDVITKEELVAVFGDNTNTTELFEALDILSGDGKVDREEFLYVMSRTVEGC